MVGLHIKGDYSGKVPGSWEMLNEGQYRLWQSLSVQGQEEREDEGTQENNGVKPKLMMWR